MVYFALLVALLAFGVDLAALLDVNDLVNTAALTQSLQRWLVPIKLLALGYLLRGALAQAETAKNLRWLIYMALALAAFMQFGYGLTSPQGADLGDVISGSLLRFGVLILILGWLGLLWLFAADRWRKIPIGVLQGYRSPLVLSAWIIGIATLLYFFDTPKLLGHLLFDLALAGLAAAMLSPAFRLRGGAKPLLYAGALGLPMMAWLAPFFLGAGQMVMDNRELLATVGADSAEVIAADDLPTLLAENLGDLTVVDRASVFNDRWWFADGRQLALSDSQLLQRTDPQSSWQPLLTLDAEYQARFVHFDQSGQRGVIGGYYEVPYRTVDGGQTWSKLATEEIFQQLAGRAFGDRLLDDYSSVYLDPQSGRGSFMMGCAFLSTEDFGDSWQLLELRDGEDRRCPVDSAMAVDAALGLARAQTLGSEYLLRQVEDDWQPFCTIDFEAALVIKDVPDCADEGVLSATQQAFVDQYETEWRIISRQLAESPRVADEADLIAILTEPNSTQQPAVRTAGQYRWVSGPGYWFSLGEGNSLNGGVIPPLTQLLPLDAEHAVGVSYDEIFVTSDGGRRWQPLPPPPDDYLELAFQTATAKGAYVQSSEQLFRLDQDGLQALNAPAFGEYESNLIAASDGETLVLQSGMRFHYSLDAGAGWQSFDLTSLLPSPTDADDVEIELDNFDCMLDQPGQPCAIVFDDTTAFAGPLTELGAWPQLPNVHKEDDYASGTLLIAGAEATTVYLPDSTSQLHWLEDDRWHKTRTGLYVEYPEQIGYHPDSDQLLLIQAAGEALLISPDGELALFDQDEWSEQTDQMNGCALGRDRWLLTSDIGRLAVTTDGGKRWQQSIGSTELGTACGSGNGYFWLLGDGLTIYQLAD